MIAAVVLRPEGHPVVTATVTRGLCVREMWGEWNKRDGLICGSSDEGEQEVEQNLEKKKKKK